MSFSLSSFVISKVISKTSDAIFKSLFEEDSPIKDIEGKLNSLQAMAEDNYLVGLKNFVDYIKINQIEKARDSLFNMSNLNCTPFANYLLGILLYQDNKKELALEKIHKAILMNPFIIRGNGVLPINGYDLLNQKIDNSSWTNTPVYIKKSFANNISGFLLSGDRWTDSIDYCKISTSGIHPAFQLKGEQSNNIGVIDISTGEIKWKISISDDNELFFATPYYLILKLNDYSYSADYRIININTGNSIADFSKEKFSLLFNIDCKEIEKDENFVKFNNYNKSEMNVIFCPENLRIGTSSVIVQTFKGHHTKVVGRMVTEWETTKEYIKNMKIYRIE